jgi:hypothetical protein
MNTNPLFDPCHIQNTNNKNIPQGDIFVIYAPYSERNPNAFPANPRRMKPPRRRSLMLASQQKSFLCFSDFARAGFFF